MLLGNMSNMWTIVKDIIWAEKFWIPSSFSWKDFENKEGGIYHPQIQDVYAAVYIAVILYGLRLLFERYVAHEIGSRLVTEKPSRKAPENKVLEESYKLNRTPDHEAVKTISKRTDLTERQIQRWFRLRRNHDKCSVLKKFKEASWRFTAYIILVFWGFYVLWDKPWFSDSDAFWAGYPHQDFSSDIYWYYMAELGLYFSLLASLFTDVKRKDFWENVIHHVVTIMLIVCTLVDNFVRIGTLITLIHDICDPFLELAKVISYASPDHFVCDILFVLFLVAWIITRLYIFPIRCIWSVINVPKIGGFYMYYGYSILLTSLFVLHLIWTFFILRVIIKRLTSNEPIQDSRSSGEDNLSEDDNENSITEKHAKIKENDL